MSARGIPPEDTELPDQAERDGAALSGAEELDEDRLAADPLESGMEPSERWAGADRYGMTAREQAEDRPLADRLAEEQPDIDPEIAPETGASAEDEAQGESAEATGETSTDPDRPDEPVRPGTERDVGLDEQVGAEAADRGQTADHAGGSMASTYRTPPRPD